MNTLCLCMIVKNEMAVLKENFDSIVDHLDYWVICDTGSTDGTQEFIKNYFKEKGIPGELHEEEWVNFGHNRSSYLKHAQGKSDYFIILDADFIVNVKDKDFKSKLKGKSIGYTIRYEGPTDFRQMFIASGNILWKYVGVTHEYITSDEAHTIEKFDGFTITHSALGSNRADKYERDIEMLTQGIKDEPNNSRYHFYLANSYKNINEPEKALTYYLKRAEMGGWPEEVYYALYEAGNCRQKTNSDFETTALPLYLKAFNYRKSRLESLYEIVKYYRTNEMWKEGYAYGLLGYETTYPEDILFINKAIHTHQFLDELAVCATNSGHHDFAIKLYNKLLNLDFLSKNDIQRIKNNKDYSLEQLKKKVVETFSLNENKSEFKENKRNIFLFWTGKEYKLIKILRDLIYLHSTNGKGYNVVLITPENLKEYVKDIPEYFYDMHPAHQADFVRVSVICDQGGIWLDSDTLVTESLDSLFDIIDNNEGFLIKENNEVLCNGVFGSRKNTKFMQTWKNNLRKNLDEKNGKIEWSEIGSDMLQEMYYENSSLFKKYEIINGLDTIYPINWNQCTDELINKPYDNYKNIVKEFQPLVLLVKFVYLELENKTEEEILNGNMPINYFINKSFENAKKIIYLKIAKNMGTSMDTCFKENEEHYTYSRFYKDWNHINFYKSKIITLAHESNIIKFKKVYKKIFEYAEKVIIIRDPLDRVVSGYNYLNSLPKVMEFHPEYVDKDYDFWLNKINRNTIKDTNSNYSSMFVHFDTLQCNAIDYDEEVYHGKKYNWIDMGNLSSLKNVFKKLNINFKNVSHINKTLEKSQPLPEKYVKLFQEKFKEDFKLYNIINNG